MKEVTRIHIAATSYDIELEAKKELEKYLNALEKYSHDDDLVEDVEIRMTEILAERGVKKDQMIALTDVSALKDQLGDPHEFMTDDQKNELADEVETTNVTTGRKLFRDPDHAVVGGVLSGIAAFFGVQVVLIRIVFVILLLASFGTAVLLYIILWAVVPPARTAADKLQMQGRAVTIASIREINENMDGRAGGMDTDTKRALLTVTGVLCVIGAAGSAFATIVVTLGAFLRRNPLFTQHGDVSHWMIVALSFAAASGLLLSLLFGILAYASLARKMTKRIVVSICTVICLGFICFATAVTITQYVVFKVRDEGPAQSVVQPMVYIKEVRGSV